MVADHTAHVPRAIALIDLPDLRLQAKRSGVASEPDVTAVLERLENGLAGLDPALSETRIALGAVYLYSPVEADRSLEAGRVVLKRRPGSATSPCWSCTRACTHCQAAATREPGGQGHDNPMRGDLLEQSREDAYDWAVVVSIDLLLIPVVRYVQSRGRKVIHGRFPQLAMDLTRECWASIDLRAPQVQESST